MKCRSSRCGAIFLFVVLGIAALGWVVMALWNWLMPALFSGVSQLGYLQALGLLLLTRILVGGLRGHGHRCGPNHCGNDMSDEEREKLRSGMRCWWSRRKQAAEEKTGNTD